MGDQPITHLPYHSQLLAVTMFRTAVLRSVRCAAQASTRVQRPAVQTAFRAPFVQSRISTPATSISAIRSYASSSGLDTVEVVMAIEEEFSIEIPDKEADAIHSVNQAVDYIMAQPDGKQFIARLSNVILTLSSPLSIR